VTGSGAVESSVLLPSEVPPLAAENKESAAMAQRLRLFMQNEKTVAGPGPEPGTVGLRHWAKAEDAFRGHQ